MALIECPECSKEISDKAKACPHCGYPINKNEELKPDVENNIMVFEGKKYDLTELVEYMNDKIEEDYDNDPSVWGTAWDILERILPIDVRGNNELLHYIRRYHHVPDFNYIPTGDPWYYTEKKPKDYDHANYWYYEKDKPEHLKAPVPRCPKCGCTNIQVVPKKWSFFTGFMTNKTDRVCANCGHKW